MAEPLDKIIKKLKNNKMINNGISQNFFLVLRKSKRSLRSSMVL